jgi:hypothetical protein
MSNPALNPDNMKFASWGLLSPGSAINATAGDIDSAIVRTRSKGPLYDMLTLDLHRIARKMAMGGTGFRSLSARLLTDAEQEIAQRRIEAQRAEAEKLFTPSFMQPR